jgi:transposase
VIAVENWKPAPELCDERARLSRREQRYDRYQQVLALYEQGLGFTEITRRVGVSRRTIERWIQAGDFPETKWRRKRRSVFDPYASYVLSRWEQGCTNGLQLCQEIQAQGYQGSAPTVYRFLRSLRKKRRVIWKSEVPQAPYKTSLPMILSGCLLAHLMLWMRRNEQPSRPFVRRARQREQPMS